MTKTDFAKHMEEVYSYVTPAYLGLTSLTEFADDVKEFAASRNVTLNPVYVSDSFTLENTSNYIKNGLNLNSPVAIVNLQPSGYEYGYHWMTVTKYFKDGTTGKRSIAVSTWGQRYSIDYGVWYDSTNFWGGGLIYFK